MDTRKKGDHFVATGLGKTLDDIAKTVHGEIGDCSEGRLLHGALVKCSPRFIGGAYDFASGKGGSATASDSHSVEFGKASKDAKWAMTSLVFALKSRRSIDVKSQAERLKELTYWNEFVGNAKASAILAIGTFIDRAIDSEVEQRLPKSLKGDAGAVRGNLEWVRSAICEAIRKM